MFKPTSKPTSAPQKAADRAAIAVQVSEVEYDTTNPAWVIFDQAISLQLADFEQSHQGLTTPLSKAKTFDQTNRR